ncbi:MAG: hypothetical protein AVDCRST_MAG43-1964, partial [uncultured Thermomicrobiales bacterium]
ERPLGEPPAADRKIRREEIESGRHDLLQAEPLADVLRIQHPGSDVV